MTDNKTIQEKIKEGVNLIENNNFVEAQKIFQNFLNNKETEATGLLLLAIINIKKKEYFKAKELLYKVLAINKFHPEANFNLALVYFAEENYDEALIYFNILIKINSSHLPSYYHIGLIHMVRNNFEEAIKFFEICKNIDIKFIPTFVKFRKYSFKKK